MDGQTEVTNRTLGVPLTALIKSNLKSWDYFLTHAEFAYNQTPSKATSLSPLKVAYRVKPLTSLDLTPPPMDQRADVYAYKRVQEIQKLLLEARLSKLIHPTKSKQTSIEGKWSSIQGI